MAEDKEVDEFTPTPELAEAYQQRFRAFIGLGLWDKYCASLQSPHSISAHQTQADCIVVPSLGAAFSVVECDDGFGIAVPRKHADWINVFPLDFIVATRSEIFFISKSFVWLNELHPALGISLGPMVASDLLARLCNSGTIKFYIADDISQPTKGELLREGKSVPILKEKTGIPLFKTKISEDDRVRSENFGLKEQIHSHFLG